MVSVTVLSCSWIGVDSFLHRLSSWVRVVLLSPTQFVSVSQFGSIWCYSTVILPRTNFSFLKLSKCSYSGLLVSSFASSVSLLALEVDLVLRLLLINIVPDPVSFSFYSNEYLDKDCSLVINELKVCKTRLHRSCFLLTFKIWFNVRDRVLMWFQGLDFSNIDIDSKITCFMLPSFRRVIDKVAQCSHCQLKETTVGFSLDNGWSSVRHFHKIKFLTLRFKFFHDSNGKCWHYFTRIMEGCSYSYVVLLEVTAIQFFWLQVFWKMVCLQVRPFQNEIIRPYVMQYDKFGL